MCSWLANLQSKTFERTDSSHVEWRHSTSRLLRLQRRQFAQPLLSVRRLPMATDNQPLTNRPRHPEWNSWTVWKISFRSLARNMCIVHYPHHTQWRTPMFLAGLLKDIFSKQCASLASPALRTWALIRLPTVYFFRSLQTCTNSDIRLHVSSKNIHTYSFVTVSWMNFVICLCVALKLLYLIVLFSAPHSL